MIIIYTAKAANLTQGDSPLLVLMDVDAPATPDATVENTVAKSEKQVIVSPY